MTRTTLRRKISGKVYVRPPRPYIEPTSPEFLRILTSARIALADAAIGPDGQPAKRGGRPRKVKP